MHVCKFFVTMIYRKIIHIFWPIWHGINHISDFSWPYWPINKSHQAFRLNSIGQKNQIRIATGPLGFQQTTDDTFVRFQHVLVVGHQNHQITGYRQFVHHFDSENVLKHLIGDDRVTVVGSHVVHKVGT